MSLIRYSSLPQPLAPSQHHYNCQTWLPSPSQACSMILTSWAWLLHATCCCSAIFYTLKFYDKFLIVVQRWLYFHWKKISLITVSFSTEAYWQYCSVSIQMFASLSLFQTYSNYYCQQVIWFPFSVLFSASLFHYILIRTMWAAFLWKWKKRVKAKLLLKGSVTFRKTPLSNILHNGCPNVIIAVNKSIVYHHHHHPCYYLNVKKLQLHTWNKPWF